MYVAAGEEGKAPLGFSERAVGPKKEISKGVQIPFLVKNS